MSMASDINNDPDTLGASVPPGAQHLVHHQICHELFMARAGVTPAQACGVGCSTCGVIDASPARCEQCTGVHAAGRHPLAGALDAAMAALDAPAAPLLRDLGDSLVQHLATEDTEGGDI